MLKCIYELSVLSYSNDADVEYCSNVYDVSVSFVSLPLFMQYYIDGLGQVYSNAIANVLELLQCYLNHQTSMLLPQHHEHNKACV